MEYAVATFREIPNLEASVDDLLSRGWVLQGGISMVVNQGVIYYAQALTRVK